MFANFDKVSSYVLFPFFQLKPAFLSKIVAGTDMNEFLVSLIVSPFQLRFAKCTNESRVVVVPEQLQT